MDVIDPFGWHVIGHQQALEIREKLSNFESMTWNEILVKARKQNHLVEVWKLCKEAQKRLEEMNLADVDQLATLRLTGQQRVWGILLEGVFSLLWWDPEHLVCPSLLKHT